MPGRLKNGNPTGKGGARPGAGRKPDKYRRALKQICRDPNSLKFLQDAMDGKAVDVRLSDGEIIHLPATADTRHKIWESIHDRVEGKPVSVLEMPDGDEATIVGVVVLPPQSRGKAGEVKE